MSRISIPGRFAKQCANFRGVYATQATRNASSAAARQLAAWREATGQFEPAVVPIALNGIEFPTESAARKFVAALGRGAA